MNAEPTVARLLISSDGFWMLFYLIAFVLVLRRQKDGGDVLRLAKFGYGLLVAGNAAKLGGIANLIQRLPARPRVATGVRSDADPMGLVFIFVGVALLVGNILILRAVLRSADRRSAA